MCRHRQRLTPVDPSPAGSWWMWGRAFISVEGPVGLIVRGPTRARSAPSARLWQGSLARRGNGGQGPGSADGDYPPAQISGYESARGVPPEPPLRPQVRTVQPDRATRVPTSVR